MTLNLLRTISLPSRASPFLLSACKCQQLPPFIQQQIRTTVILKRKWPVLFAKEGNVPHLKYKNKVYDFVENTSSKKLPDIECILTRDLDGIGYKHEMVKVKRKLFRKVLYPAGLAMYASPENIKEFVQMEDTKTDRSPWAKMTMNCLSSMYLVIPMSGDNPWTLTPKHVKVAFRLVGIEINEDSIILPKEPITEAQELEFTVLMNETDQIQIKSLILLKHKDSSKNEIPENLPPTFSHQNSMRKQFWLN